MIVKKLHLEDLNNGMPAITPEFGACLAQAGSICLEDQGHELKVPFGVQGEFEGSYELVRAEITEQMRRCWNDQEVTTELGAYGVAILVVKDQTDYTVLERSRKGTGFDYWLGTGGNLFQKKVRLEVSGIRRGDQASIQRRLFIKEKQITKSDMLGLPALVAIVEFSKPISKVVKK